jgi:hypothetical protein
MLTLACPWPINFRGSKENGANIGAVTFPKPVVSMTSTYSAFAAILQDGTAIAWGEAIHGGNATAVKSQLFGVQTITSTYYAFAALCEGGRVVTWCVYCYVLDSLE